MPSAAARVFALPELLETILLNLSWRDLFSILRTNATFLNTIMSSSKLGRRMHLEYKLPGDEPGIDVPEYRTHHSIINDLYISRELDLSPFKGAHTEARRYWQLDGQDRRRTFAIDFQMPSSEFFKNTYIGISTRLRARKEAPPGSWRAMKLTHLREPFRVVIQVRSPSRYDEVLTFAAGEGTLGEVVDSMDRIRKRTSEEHYTRWCQLRDEQRKSRARA